MEFGNFSFLEILGYSVLLLKTLNRLMYRTLHLATKFYHLTYHRKIEGTKITKIIYRHPSQPPVVTLNTYDSSKYNPSKTGGGRVLRNSKGRWIIGFQFTLALPQIILQKFGQLDMV